MTTPLHADHAASAGSGQPGTPHPRALEVVQAELAAAALITEACQRLAAVSEQREAQLVDELRAGVEASIRAAWAKSGNVVESFALELLATDPEIADVERRHGATCARRYAAAIAKRIAAAADDAGVVFVDVDASAGDSR